MYQVDGFVFESRERARQAKKEAEGVSYIREHNSLKDPDEILKLYNNLLEQNLFETEVGISFLRELQEHLQMIPYIKKEDIRPIPAVKTEGSVAEIKRRQERERKKERELSAVCIVLAAIVAGMFIITYAGGKSKNIFNYKNEIINEYEAWEKELNEREEELNLREEQLQIRENRVQNLLQ